MQLTVYFDGQYWVGLTEASLDNGFRVVRHIFGPEPSDLEVFEYTIGELRIELAQAPATSQEQASNEGMPRFNHKRAIREAAKQMRQPVVSAQAQEAMHEQREAVKKERQQQGKAVREAEAAHKRAVAEAKLKQKRRGH